MTQAITLPLWIFIALLALALLECLLLPDPRVLSMVSDYANSIDHLCKQLGVPLIQTRRP